MSQVELSFSPVAPEPEVELEDQTPKVYLVSELVQLASMHLTTQFGDVWVEGEVSNLRKPASGHCYFTLKDAQAQLSAVMFRGSVSRLPFRLEDGQKLRCWGRLGIYEAQGRFQLIAANAEPVGAGALQLAFEQLKKKLSAEGLFAAEHKQPLPYLPRHIAIVTSATGAALQDMLRVLRGRCPVRVTVCPAAVQGNAAEAEIAAALGRADRLGADLIITGRGGGSLEDLWPFNTEGVARAIFAAKTPVVSAVGHEIDLTISDMVADVRAPTPTAAAQLAVPLWDELRATQARLVERLTRAVGQQLRQKRTHLEHLARRVGRPQQQINHSRLRLDEYQLRMSATLRQRINHASLRLGRFRERLSLSHPRAQIASDRRRLEQLQQGLCSSGQALVTTRRAQLVTLIARLDALSPLAILGRGYSVVFDKQGTAMRHSQQASAGDLLKVRLHQGALDVTVKRVMD